MKKNNLPAIPTQARGRQGTSSTNTAQHPALSPHPCVVSVLLQLKHLQPFPASASVPEGFPALAHLVAPAGHVLSPDMGPLLALPPRFQGRCPTKLIPQAFSVPLGALPCGCRQGCQCRPFPSPSVTWESFALPNKMIGGGGLTFITSPSKQRTKSPQPPPARPPDNLQDMQVQGNRGEQVTLSSIRYLSPCLALGSTGFPNFMSLTQCPWTGCSLPLLLHQAAGGFEFRNSLNTHPEQSLLGRSVP